MAIGDIGLFTPAESQYKTPGAYDESLRAEALKRSNYLAMMDQFYEQLDETKREFDATSALKTAALAQDRWIAEQQIGLSKEDLALRRETSQADLALRTRALEEQTAYGKEALGVERMKINSLRPANQLGGTSLEDSLRLLQKYSTTAGGATKAISPMKTLADTGVYPAASGSWPEGPQSTEVASAGGESSYDWYA